MLKDLIRKEAKRLDVAPEILAAVLEVETGKRSGFLRPGVPKILYEAHIFSRLTERQYDLTNPMLSSRAWNRSLYLGGGREYTRLDKAKKLDALAALQSCSWGRGQIMGFHYLKLGFETIDQFVLKQATTGGQIETFGRFLEVANIVEPMRQLQFHSIARRYNGPGYRKNRYAAKIETAYLRLYQNGHYTTATSTTVQAGATHEALVLIERGDTLYKIAHHYLDGDLAQLLALNPEIVDPNHIDVGQAVRVA